MTTTDGVPDRQPASGTTSNSPRPFTLALVNDYEIVVAGLAALLQPYVDRVSKAAPIGRVVHALERIAAGERVIELSQTSGASMVTAWPGKELDLTEREAEVMSLIAQGFSNDEIARLCYLSINTVKTYIRSAYRKAGVNTRAQAVAWALRHGFQPERTGRL